MVSVSCVGRCGKYVTQKPANVKPIDTENYNDVYTVYWNYFDNATNPYSLREVLMCGYVVVYGMDKSGNLLWYPMLTDDSIKAINYVDMHITKVYFSWSNTISDQINSIVNTSIPNKCYIRGFVELEYTQFNNCETHYIPKLVIVNAEDIYFKND